MTTDERPPLLLVKGSATDEEIAALTAVLQAMAAAAGPADPRPPRSEWASPHRLTGGSMRTSLRHGPGAWRASALPG